MTSPKTTPEGWYPDPADPTLERYWDGSAWTDRLKRPSPSGLPTDRNGAGVAALIVGIVAAALSLVPFFIVWTWILALAALVLGIIGLALRERRKTAAGWGLALSITAFVAGIAISAATLGVINSQPPTADPAALSEPAATEAPAAPVEQPAAPVEPAPPVEQPAAPVAQQPAAPVVEAPAPAPPAADAGWTLSQKNAVEKGKSYLRFMTFSRIGLIGQLEYEGFSTDDATFAVDTIAPDWNANAAKKAQSYLDMMSFSRSGLYDQLAYEGFEPGQIEAGLAAVGY